MSKGVLSTAWQWKWKRGSQAGELVGSVSRFTGIMSGAGRNWSLCFAVELVL